MMIPEIMKELYEAGVKIWIEDDQLCINASKKVLSEERLVQLKEKKQDIMAFLRQATTAASLPYSAKIVPAARPEFLPLSFAQERLWFLDRLEPESNAYNLPMALRIKGKLDLGALKQSLNEIVRRHETLRTTFKENEGRSVQVIASRWQGKLQVINLCEVEASQKENEVKRLVEKEGQKSFDLERGPLLRASLLILGDEDYVLTLTMHHIISDGWSMQIFRRELGIIYEAYQRGDKSPLPELTIQYADFAVWQRNWLQGEELERQLNYWKRKLQGTPDALELPADHPRPPMQSYRGAEEEFAFSREMSEGLERLCKKEGVTLFMVLLAAFKVLLYRYTSQTDIVVGTPMAGRNQAEIESLIGFFLNTLVLRTDLGGRPTFKELLLRVKETTLEAYTYQNIPFEKLLAELKSARDLSRSPFFQIFFNLLSMSHANLEFPGVEVQWMDLKMKNSKFDLSLNFWQNSQGLEGYVEYSTDLFEPTTISRLIDHYKTLVTGIIADPDKTIDRLLLLSKEEKHLLLTKWNNSAEEFPQDKCFHELFEEMVEQRPDAVAVVCENKSLCYEALNCYANKVAHYLRELGIGPDSLVGICLERSLDLVGVILGILKAGGAYLPLDPLYPPERLSFMIVDSQIQVLMTHSFLASIFSEHSSLIKIACLDKEQENLSGQNWDNPSNKTKGDNLAYIIYTSGSTGKPKGVMIPQRSLTCFMNAATVEYAISCQDRILQFSSISFDAAVEEIFPFLGRGATVVLRTDEMIGSATSFVDKCRELDLTVLDFPMAFWHQLSTEIIVSLLSLPASIRLIILGGDRVNPESIKAWQGRFGKRHQLKNTYGPTEATVVATSCELTEYFLEAEGLQEIPIGRPLLNVQTYILDRFLQPVPLGVIGELHIGGAGLARGYLNKPDLTVEKFVPNPFSNRQGDRLYKTGDLARYLPDGNLEFRGRLDQQVKIRGFRIELGEIEAVLRQHPGLNEVVVAVRDRMQDMGQTDSNGGHRIHDPWLVAYVIPKQMPGPPNNELLDFMKKKLPDYMLPSVFVILEAMPLTPNGKLDRKALPAPEMNKERGLAMAEIARSADIKDWFYAPTWKQTPFAAYQPGQVTDRWLVFDDGKGLGKTLVQQLRKNGRDVVMVSKGKRFAARRHGYILRPGFDEDYRALLAELQKQDRLPNNIIHLWNITPLDKNTLKNPDKALQSGFYSLLFLAQTLGRQEHDQDISLTIVSSHMQKVVAEDTLQPEKATLLGLCRVIPQELSRITCRSIDVEIPKARSPKEAQLAEQIIAETVSPAMDAIIAYRGLKRWVQVYEPRIQALAGSILRKGGVYLVTASPEGLGFRIALSLARTMQARIVLITETPLPEPEMQQEYLKTHDLYDPGCLLIQAVKELEALGLPGLPIRAEITDQAQMKAVVRAACRRFGTLHGVIHAAGFDSGQRILSENLQTTAKVLAPCIQGIQILKSVLEDMKLDFFLLCSPLSSLIGGFGQGTPCAAVAYMTAFSLTQIMNKTPTCLAVHWDVDKGLNVEGQTEWNRRQDQALEHVFDSRFQSPLIISGRHLPSLMEQTGQIARLQAKEAASNLLAHDSGSSGGIEEKLALIWKDLLGVRTITRNDSFFRVGGHSLVAIQLLNRVRDTFKVDIALRTSFEAPTIAELAQRIEQAHKEVPSSLTTPPESMIHAAQPKKGLGQIALTLMRRVLR